MVGSSVIAAWADISSTLARMSDSGLVLLDPTSGADVPLATTGMLGRVNVGYLWMFVNCVASAAYVSYLDYRRRSSTSSADSGGPLHA